MRLLSMLTLAMALLAPPVVGAQPATAQKTIDIELNRIEPQDKACRAYFVVRNGLEQLIPDLKLDVFIFDKAGVVARRFAISTGQLRPGKTVVRLFDIPDLDCASADRFLLNEVLSCGGPADTPTCGDRITVAARGGLRFEY